MTTKRTISIVVLAFILGLLCASAIAQRVPREFSAVNGFELKDVKLDQSPLPASTVWLYVATTPPPWYGKLLFWKDRPIFDAPTFTRDVIRVDHLLRREGWRNITVRGEVLPEKNDRISAVYHIRVGECTKTNRYWINATELPAKDTLSFRRYLSLTRGRRYREIELQQAVDSLHMIYLSHGYARAKVTSEVNWQPDSLGVDLSLHVNAGNICQFDTASVQGLTCLKPKDVTADLLTKPGLQYSTSLIERSRRILYSRNVFRSIDLVADTSVKSDRLPIRIRVVEANRWQAKFGAAWVTDKNWEQQWEGLGELTDRFILGSGRTLKISGSASYLQTFGAVSVSFPHAIGPGSEFVVAPYAKRSWEFSFNAIGSKQTVNFLSGQWWSVSFSQDLQRSWKFDTTNHRDASLTTDQQNILNNRDLYTVTGLYDFRKDPFESTEGGIFSPELSVSGVLFRNTYRFYKFKCYGNYAITFDRKLTYATRFEAGSIFPNGAPPPPNSEDLFYLGGSGLMRGWARNSLSPRGTINNKEVSIGGQAMLAGAFEIRAKVWGPLWWANFIDAGNVWSKYQSFGKWPLMTTVGTGVRLHTPIGPFRFDIGWQTRDNPFRASGKPESPQFILAIGEAI